MKTNSDEQKTKSKKPVRWVTGIFPRTLRAPPAALSRSGRRVCGIGLATTRLSWARASGEDPWIGAHCTPTPDRLAPLSQQCQRPQLRGRAPSRRGTWEPAKGGCKDCAERGRAASCSAARCPTFPRAPAPRLLTLRVPGPGGGGDGARKLCDGGGGERRRLDGLAAGPQAARPRPAPRSRTL